MMTKKELKRFLDWPAIPESRVLSIYLNIESSGEAVLRRRFEVAFRALIQSLECEGLSTQSEHLAEDIERASRFIAGYQPSGHGLVLFVDASEDFLWAKELRIPVPSQVCWLERPYVLPLLEAFDEYECYGVILVDKKRARVFTYTLGEIAEEKGALAWNDVRHFRTTGRDNMRSASKLQRTNEMHEMWHLKHVARMLKAMAKRAPFDRLILGGAKEAIDALSKLLSEGLRSKIVGRLLLAIDVPDEKLQKELRQLQEQIERQEEGKLVEKLIRPERPENHRALGLDAVLNHLNRGVIHQLIYSAAFKPAGSRCPGCGYLFSQARQMCGRCGSPIEPAPHLLEQMARRVVQTGGTIEEVREEAGQDLDRTGGIGAILKRRY